MTVQDAETDPDNQLLDHALPAIARLEASLADECEATRLAVHSANLLDTLTNLDHAIAGESEQLNALDLIAPGMWRAEEFHSRIIRWLLDPSAHHRQARHFITALLNSTMAPPRLLDLDWSTAQVLREWRRDVDEQWGYLDILILDRDHQNLIAIENKTLSQEHSNQLSYQLPPALWPMPIPISPGTTSSCPLPVNRPSWSGIESTGNRPATPSYTTPSRKSLRSVVSRNPTRTHMLQIYATAIRRNVMPDTSIDQQARRLYLEHWEALDRIFANKPDWIEETKPILREAVAKHSCWKLDLEAAQLVRFRAADWDEFPSTRTGTG